jgi:hypothetical protein
VDRVLEALRTAGSPLKASRKSLTKRVGGWVVKESRRTLLETVKHALRPGRYRAAWRAAVYLNARGVPVPAPKAYVERKWGGLVLSNAVICEYLDGWVNVEDHSRRMRNNKAPDSSVAEFLAGLADAVNRLSETGAVHTDLAGKNIFTRDGTQFTFIDLDGVVLGRAYTAADRLLNHVQHYDSFCDLWTDSLLAPFINRMLPDNRDKDAWFNNARAAQALRRARAEAAKRMGRRGVHPWFA